MPPEGASPGGNRRPVGHDDLTDAPNFGTKFGWRRPCPRYGVPIPRPSSPAGPSTTKSRRQNYQALPNLVSLKAKGPKRPQSPRPHPPSQRPSYRNPPYSSGWFPKEGPKPFLWSSEGSGGKYEIPPEFFFGGLGVYSFNLKRIHPQMPPSILGTHRPVGLPRGGFPASQMGRGLPDLHQKPKTLYFI